MSMFLYKGTISGGSGGGGEAVEVVDNLTTADASKALSANQGKLLNDKITDLNTKITASENLKVFDQELYGMRVFNDTFQYFNTTTSEWVTIQGGSSVAIDVVDNLTSTDTDKALSANQGKVLNDKLSTHETKIASTTELGHVKIDDATIKINPDGTIYAVQQEGTPIEWKNYQMVLPTIQDGQTEWDIPVPELDKDKHTVIVSHNTTLLTNEMYEITSLNGVHTLKILNNLPYEIAKNNVFIIIIGLGNNDGSSGGGSTVNPTEDPVVTKIYQYELETTVVSQKTWKIPLDTFNPNTDHLVVYHNSTYVPPSMWTVSANPSGGYDVTLPYDRDMNIENNQTDIMIFKNYPAGLDDFINGTLVLDKTITIDKLSQEVQDKLNSASKVEVATTSSTGVVKPDGTTIAISEDGTISNMFMPTIKHYQTTRITDPDNPYKRIFLLDFAREENDFLEVIFNDVVLDIGDFQFVNAPEGSAIRLNITEMVDYDTALVHGFLYRGFNILR